MTGAEDAADQDQDPLEQDRALRKLPRDQPDGHEKVAGHRRREQFERPFDPQVHHPPAPEVRDRERVPDAGQRNVHTDSRL